MLGKLFNLTTGSIGGTSAHGTSPTSKASPESIQEEIHTRSLLFPDTGALHYRQDQLFPLPSASALPAGSHPDAFDYDADLDIDARDVRVIIMQDSLASVNPSVLFDSHPLLSVASTDRPPLPGNLLQQSASQDLRRQPTSQRKGSIGPASRPLVIQPGSPQPRQGAFDRRGSVQSRAYVSAESESQRAAREYREELANFSNCIFANTEVMSYKGTSTKVHIIPPSDTRSSITSNALATDGRGSLGRSSMRSSKLAQSFTTEAANPQITTPTTQIRQIDRNKILVTRLFPVNLPNDDGDTSAQSRISEHGVEFPFPYSPDESKMKKKKPKPITKRTPMYAVALVLQLPSNPPNNAGTAPKPVFRGSGSYTEQDAFPSSFGSARKAGWTMVGPGYGSESFESTYSTEVEDRMDFITQHWDIIMRTLTHLQSVVASALFPMLKQADQSVPDPHPSTSTQVIRTSSIGSRRGSDASQPKQPKTYAKLVTLPPNSLTQDQNVGREVENAKIRAVTGLRAARVVTGQGRWGPWREEARWVAKWAGSKEQGFFFYNLLTGFLATHTDWLQALSPVWYRRRHYQQQKAKSEEDTSLPSRTIIVAKDKMAARRLIFLLSAYLPASQQFPTARSQRPATSASFAAFGHSPPTYVVPINKEESLRRKINRRQGPRGASHSRSFSIQSQVTTRSTSGIPPQLSHLSMDLRHERRSSEAMKPADLPMVGGDFNTRKSSAATTNTIVQDATIPHFSTSQQFDATRDARRGSSASVAADGLKRSLKRADSRGHASRGSTDSRQSLRWGNVLSGLWSARRRDSAITTSQTLEIPDDLGSPLASPTKVTVNNRKFSGPLLEARTIDPLGHNQPAVGDPYRDEPITPSRLEATQFDPQPRVPDPLGAFVSPVKTSINADDGVIDVDVNFPEYLTSFETAVSSPSSSGYLSTPGMGPGLDSFEQFSRLGIEGDVPLNVAGWLEQFHPDFALQAIPPQQNLLDEVRDALKAEPTPPVAPQVLAVEWPLEQWVDVSTAIVANTVDFTIRRLRYRRLVKLKPTDDKRSANYLTSHGSSTMTPALSPYEQPIQDKIDEEVLVTFDEGLIDAVERVIAQSGDTSRESSANSSRSASKGRGRSDSEASDPTGGEGQVDHPDFREVSRSECKTVVLSALGNIVQTVAEEHERDNQGQKHDVTYDVVREKESPLRRAVRGWLENVELRDG